MLWLYSGERRWHKSVLAFLVHHVLPFSGAQSTYTYTYTFVAGSGECVCWLFLEWSVVSCGGGGWAVTSPICATEHSQDLP